MLARCMTLSGTQSLLYLWECSDVFPSVVTFTIRTSVGPITGISRDMGRYATVDSLTSKEQNLPRLKRKLNV